MSAAAQVALGAAPPPWVAAAALIAVAVGATATATSVWIGQRGRRAVLARLAQPGARARRALFDADAADGYAAGTANRWHDALTAVLARLLPASLRSGDAAAALARAGYFEPHAVLYYAAARLLAPLLFTGAAFAAGGSTPPVLALGLLAGVVAPSAFLDRQAGARRAALSVAIPDALDLLVVCLEAGVGVDAAMVRVARELAPVHPVLAAELENVTRRVSAGLPRDEALRALVARTGIDDLRSIASTMIQADRLGTSLARVLRIHGEALRTRRRQTAEKKAAEASVKMIIPLVLFLLPAFFTVVLGPAVLSLIANSSEP